MKTSVNGRAFIKREEGERLKAYPDSRGILTIGVGHTSAAGDPVVKRGMKITAQQSDAILARDLGDVEDTINSAVKVQLSQNQFDALASLIFNIGSPKFKTSTLLKKLNKRDYAGAADQFLVWKKAGADTDILLKRRERERKLFLSEDKAQPSAASSGAMTNKAIVTAVQQQLKDLGYTEVGNIDGKLGKQSRAAILAFRSENGLPLTPEIDQQLLDALDDAPQRQLARNDAPAALVRAQVPEVKANWRMKVAAVFAGATGAIGSFFDGILANLGVARGYVDNVKDYASDVPGWLWMLLVVGVAGGVYYVANRGEKKGIEAYQNGERR